MLTIYTLEQSERWDSIVCSFKEYDAYWLSGYVRAFRIHGDGEPLLFHYSDDSVNGINVVMMRDVAKDKHFVGRIPEGKYFDFATPYGYGGWIIESVSDREFNVESTAAMFHAYCTWCENHNVVSEFVRFHPMIKNHEKCRTCYAVAQLGEVVHMDISSRSGIWENIISKNRNMIRKAIKNGVKIYNGRFPEIYKQFQSVYNRTMDKDDADDYYYFGEAFYESVLDDLPYNAQIFWAEKDKHVIASSIMLATNGRMNYHLSGSLREFSSLAPTNLLLYEAALWGNANGYKTLYLGGGVGSGEDSLFRFKRAFYKGALNRFYIGKKIFIKEKYEELLLMREPLESGFFPKYRA